MAISGLSCATNLSNWKSLTQAPYWPLAAAAPVARRSPPFRKEKAVEATAIDSAIEAAYERARELGE